MTDRLETRDTKPVMNKDLIYQLVRSKSVDRENTYSQVAVRGLRDIEDAVSYSRESRDLRK